MQRSYVHGYDVLESVRLQDQAQTLESLLHGDTAFPAGSTVLEAGCGVGAQTIPLARNSPGARITALELSPGSLAIAQSRTRDAGILNVTFQQGDIFALPFPDDSFDHVFVCFVLEHLRDPGAALIALMRVLRPGGSIVVIEGDHGSTFFYPNSEAARAAIACQVELQCLAGGDALIGRQLYPLLQGSGFANVTVSPRMVYVDGSKPGLVDGFIRKTFTAMVDGVREQAIATGLADAAGFEAGIQALCRTAEPDGVFCYTFFKAIGFKPIVISTAAEA